jgi:glycine hydroxymethyltransferase
VVGAWTSNYDAARLASLSVALAEAREFMPAYARKMLENAHVLGQALTALGVDVAGVASPQDLPETHQLVIRCRDREQALALSKLAQANGMYIGTCSVPGEPGAGGLRLGTQAVTRKGADSADMLEIAGCLASLVSDSGGMDVPLAVRNIASRLTGFRYGYTS